MTRLSIKMDVLRALFARSGNQCAFPDCTHPLVNAKNQFIAQICHIEGAKQGGQRFNPDGNNEHRRSYENLLILCYPHHIETNDVEEYTVERLIGMKEEHEQLCQKTNFKLDESELYKLTFEMEKYWSDIDHLNKVEHIYSKSGLVMNVKGDSNFFEILSSAYDSVNGVENLFQELHNSDETLKQNFEDLLRKRGVSPDLFKDVPYYQNPFEYRSWELHNLGVPNVLQRLRIDLVQLEVRYLEEYLKTHGEDLKAKASFEVAKEALKEYARTAIHVD